VNSPTRKLRLDELQARARPGKLTTDQGRAAIEAFDRDIEPLLEYVVRRAIQNGQGRRLISPQLAPSDPFQPDHPVMDLLVRRKCRQLAAGMGFGATLRKCARWLQEWSRGAGQEVETVQMLGDSPTLE
jgi:hypothetical protein